MADEGLRAAFAQGAREWPQVAVSVETFERYVCEVSGEPLAGERARHAGDLYLCCGCLSGVPHARESLERRFFPEVGRALARIKSDDDFIQETLQALRAKLLTGPEPRLRAYSGRGPLQRWLKVTATRLGLDSLRGRNAPLAGRDNALLELAASDMDPLSAMLKERYTEAFQSALRDALTALSDRDRTLLRLRLVDGCGIDRLGRMYQVDRATAARWLGRARDAVLDNVRRKLSREYGMTRQEFFSLARVVLSQLELRPSALETPPGALGAHAGTAEHEP